MADPTETESNVIDGVDAPDDLLETLQGWFRQDFDAMTEWREEAEKDYAYHAGHGAWSEEDKAKLEAQGRPCVSFNRIQPVIASVVGMAINDRKEVTFLPRTTQDATMPGAVDPQTGQPSQVPVPGADDQGPAETFTAGAQYLRDQCDAEDEEADAYQDDAICGIGWVETSVSYDGISV